eukprot:gene2160-2659_t
MENIININTNSPTTTIEDPFITTTTTTTTTNTTSSSSSSPSTNSVTTIKTMNIEENVNDNVININNDGGDSNIEEEVNDINKNINGKVEEELDTTTLSSSSLPSFEPARKPDPSNVEADLACLDNKFFQEEVNKLYSIAQSIQTQLSSNNSKTSMNNVNSIFVRSKRKQLSQQDSESLYSIKDTLQSLRSQLSDYEHFVYDPKELLSKLYMIEATLADIKYIYLNISTNGLAYNDGGSSSGGNCLFDDDYYYSNNNGNGNQYYNNNYNEYDDDFYYDDQEDHYIMNNQKKYSGRKSKGRK